MTDDQELRPVRVCLVGTSTDPGLMRLSTYLANAHALPITVVTFQVFEVGSGQRVLLRELTEAETQPPTGEEKPRLTVEDVCKRAEAKGIGTPFRRILELASRLGLYPRPYAGSIMYAPPANRTRLLFTVWTRPHQPGVLRIWVGPTPFTEFYPISQSIAEEHLGTEGWQMLTEDGVDKFLQGLENLFSLIDQARA